MKICYVSPPFCLFAVWGEGGGGRVGGGNNARGHSCCDTEPRFDPQENYPVINLCSFLTNSNLLMTAVTEIGNYLLQ